MLHHTDLILANYDFGVGEGCNVYAYLAEEIGGEFGNGGGINNELAVDAHESLWVELTLCLFKRHRQRMGATRKCAKTDNTVTYSDMAHITDGDNKILICMVGN